MHGTVGGEWVYLLSVWVNNRGSCWNFVCMTQLVNRECTCCLCGLVTGAGVGSLCV